jgi:protein-tyrosine phosphatase/arsenate reductase
MSQIWAATAAAHYDIPSVSTYSGGTEATAFNSRAVSALERAGFQITKTSDSSNPAYEVRCGARAAAWPCFSKIYTERPNPDKEFAALMTCTQADKQCPYVRGADARLSIPYDDPKVADNTPGEAAKYDERCRQIARELLYVFSQVKPSAAGE